MRALGEGSAMLVLIAAAASCSGGSAKAIDGATTSDVGNTGDHASEDTRQNGDVDRTRDVATEVPADAAIVPPANVMFPEPPEVACHGDATDCPFPPSSCANPGCDGGTCAGLAWVVYYDSPTCVNSKCAYAKRYFECDVSSQCSAGGCRFNGTLAAAQ
jgi:hypothetical protein